MRTASLNCSGIGALTLQLFVAVAIMLGSAAAQQAPPCSGETELPAPGVSCPYGIPLTHGSFHATPLMDGNVDLTYPPNPQNDPLGIETVTLYGEYGNDENDPNHPEAQNHYSQGQTQARMVQPLDRSGHYNANGAIVALFIGFSNCEIEICGGSSDAWAAQGQSFPGQPCATGSTCPNPRPNDTSNSWNDAMDGVTQKSLLYQAYSPANGGPLVGSHVYLFNGATGHQPLPNWDPYNNPNTSCSTNPECNYTAVAALLNANGFYEPQVQVLFLYASTSYPQCDLSGIHCNDPARIPDAYRTEQYMGDIMRYLKQGIPNHNPPIPPRYPNLKQVFIMTRNYGGYAQNDPRDQNSTQGCLNPEPFAYEQGFSAQRLIVAQIKQTNNISGNDSYSGNLHYDQAPWFDWGPYLWASGGTPRVDGLVWCDNDTDPLSPCFAVRDFRWGDESTYYGDLTHPAQSGQAKAATKILFFLLHSGFTKDWIGL